MRTWWVQLMAKHRAGDQEPPAKAKRKLPPPGTVNGEPQIKSDKNDPKYDDESTFGNPWS
jgi:hypothetical protein